MTLNARVTSDPDSKRSGKSFCLFLPPTLILELAGVPHMIGDSTCHMSLKFCFVWCGRDSFLRLSTFVKLKCKSLESFESLAYASRRFPILLSYKMNNKNLITAFSSIVFSD